jgi:hypothetical protein
MAIQDCREEYFALLERSDCFAPSRIEWSGDTIPDPNQPTGGNVRSHDFEREQVTRSGRGIGTHNNAAWRNLACSFFRDLDQLVAERRAEFLISLGGFVVASGAK